MARLSCGGRACCVPSSTKARLGDSSMRKSTVILAAAVCVAAYGISLTLSAAAVEPKKVAIASLVQPIDNPWVVNNVRFQKSVAKALNIELVVISDKGTEDSNNA